MRLALLVQLLFLLHLPLSAQLEGANWFFGENQGLDFSDGEPKIITGSPLLTREGCASYSTPTGDLLFFTNGGGRPESTFESPGEIFDAQFNLMYDMMGTQGGGFSAQQSSIIFPVPQGNNTFYLFTIEEIEFNTGGTIPSQPEGRGLSYFIIDMNANAGLGEVVVADERVFVPTYESLTAVQHDNGQDYWVIITSEVGDQFLVFSVTAAGVSNPVSYDVPSGQNNYGTIKVSPNRQKLYANNVVYDFDASNGQISNPYALSSSGFFKPSFSANSQYLYLASLIADPDYYFYQYDVSVPNINSTFNPFDTLSGSFLSQLQLAPDHQIYFIRETSNQGGLLERISCANSSNPKIETVIDNHDFGLVVSLPNFTDHLFRKDEVIQIPDVELGPDINNCNSQMLQLDAGNPGMNYQWSTGDTTQTIEVMSAGTYSVTVSNSCCQEDVDEINIYANPQFDLLSESTNICQGELITVPINIAGVYPLTISYLNNGMPEIANLNMPGDSLTVFIQGPTLLSFSLLSNGNCSTDLTDEFIINFVDSDTTYAMAYTCEVADTGTVVEIIELPGECNQTQITQIFLSPDVDCLLDGIFTTFEAPTCHGGSNGLVCLELSAGLTPVNYSFEQLSGGDANDTGTYTDVGDKLTLSQLTEGEYNIELTSANGITTSIPFELTAPPELIFDFEIQDSISCAGAMDGSVLTLAQGGVPPYTFYWDYEIIPNPWTQLEEGPYNILLIDSVGCRDYGLIYVEAPSPLMADGQLSLTPCSIEGATFSYQNVTGGTTPYTYTLENFGTQANPLFSNIPDGSYEASLIDARGCRLDTSLTIIGAQVGWQIILPTELTIELGDSILLQPDVLIPSTTSGQWQDQSGTILCENCSTVKVSPIQDTRYFFVIEETECEYENELLVKVTRSENVFFPNSFSPNDDGKNDYYEFFVKNNFAQVKSFRVYDRWGELVHAAFDLPAGDPGLRWDGKLKSQEMNPDVYVYFAELIFVDGAERRYQGDILLIR